jgi:biotin synthase
MIQPVEKILKKDQLQKDDILRLLQSNKVESNLIFKRSAELKKIFRGNKVYFRGLIEFSNICYKNCFYCGIRAGNAHVVRYDISDEEILGACRFAYESNYGSIVLQSGEVDNPVFTDRINRLIFKIKELSDGKLGITLSLGEQTLKTYQQWFNSGAHRYLLRIESSNPDLYRKIHPDNPKHDYKRRLQALEDLKDTGYLVGTGVMIGLPFQTIENLAEDLLFMKDFGIDMCGMGPYIEHQHTPMYEFKDQLISLKERFDLSLKMVAVLRIMMPHINIAATTALQAIDPIGREKAIKVGANIIMPNITPCQYRENYKLYENKPCTDESAVNCQSCMEARIGITGDEIGYGEWGDSRPLVIKE